MDLATKNKRFLCGFQIITLLMHLLSTVKICTYYINNKNVFKKIATLFVLEIIQNVGNHVLKSSKMIMQAALVKSYSTDL